MANRKAMWQEFWMKAFEFGEVVVTCKDAKELSRRRFEAYTAVAKIKKNPGLSPRLAEAVEGCVITRVDEVTFAFERRSIDDDLRKLSESLGIDLEAIQPAAETFRELEALESANRMAGLVGLPQAGGKPGQVTMSVKPAISPERVGYAGRAVKEEGVAEVEEPAGEPYEDPVQTGNPYADAEDYVKRGSNGTVEDSKS